MGRPLADATWPDVLPAPLVLVPVGSIEQHGPHLPLDTDTVIATAIAERMAAALDGDVLVAPAITYGASGEHQSFPGTISIGTALLASTVVELTRSLRAWAGRVVLVNAHGGNVAALDTAVTQLTYEGYDVAWVACASEEIDLHAGRGETSLMLHLRPASVRLDRAAAGNRAPLRELLPAMLAGGVGAVSANGVLGDPAGASAAEGARVLSDMTQQVLAQLTTARAR
jgi:creatinine amidohydrolase